MRRYPKSENLAKLSAEQRKIFEAWQEEAEKSEEIIQSLLDAIVINDVQLINSLAQQLEELIPYYCEHGRSVYSSCLACNEIERMLFPDAYDADGNRIGDWYSTNTLKDKLN